MVNLRLHRLKEFDEGIFERDERQKLSEGLELVVLDWLTERDR